LLLRQVRRFLTAQNLYVAAWRRLPIYIKHQIFPFRLFSDDLARLLQTFTRSWSKRPARRFDQATTLILHHAWRVSPKRRDLTKESSARRGAVG
jgi:hypothetical protein